MVLIFRNFDKTLMSINISNPIKHIHASKGWFEERIINKNTDEK